jgi:hypothetical protein
VTKKDGTPVVGRKTKQPLFVPASTWLAGHRRVEQITWVPGRPEMIKDKLVVEGGWIERQGMTTFNMYMPPIIRLDDLQNITVVDVAPWLNHIQTIYPDDTEHLLKWMAHRAQRPGEKINHCLLLGGEQGIGKDSILEPLKYAVGPWNFREISPHRLLGEFNGYMRAVVLRISEARDLGEVNRFAFYEHFKTITVTPPDVIEVNEKHLREYNLFNVCGVILTTNHKIGGIYLPPDDRRTYVAWSKSKREDFNTDYWDRLWAWYLEQDGIRKVAAFLKTYDLSCFNAKAPPPRTPAFFEIVASGVPQEELELLDLIERLGEPDALTIRQLSDKASKDSELFDLASQLEDRTKRKAIAHRLEACGYVLTKNPGNKQGVFVTKTWCQPDKRKPAEPVSHRHHVYAKTSLAFAAQVNAVRAMIKEVEAKSEAEVAVTDKYEH